MLTIVTETLEIRTRREMDIQDITTDVQAVIERSGVREGQALLFVVGSTAALTTVEYEPGLLEDLPTAFERLAPRGARYAHHERWHDGNGHSHVRASLTGPSLTVPIATGRLTLGTWQQIILIECDTHGRDRRIVVQLMGIKAATGEA
jgi:secondary thiamine-phosphate synthase enzyme